LPGAPNGESHPASEWVPSNGRSRMIRDASVTQDRCPVPAVVCVKESGMKDSWCLATSRIDLDAKGVVNLYGKRFTIEENFRDTKDQKFGLGLSLRRTVTSGTVGAISDLYVQQAYVSLKLPADIVIDTGAASNFDDTDGALATIGTKVYEGTIGLSVPVGSNAEGPARGAARLLRRPRLQGQHEQGPDDGAGRGARLVLREEG